MPPVDVCVCVFRLLRFVWSTTDSVTQDQKKLGAAQDGAVIGRGRVAYSFGLEGGFIYL